jgi:maltose/maltodextrin transport system permease protein
MSPTARPRWPRHLIVAALVAAALYAVTVVHASGQTLLALTLLAIAALALWTYTSPRTQALRYLFPGVAAALVFVIFPMLYTVGIGFTNYSSRNLLEFDRARAYLLEEAVQVPGSERAFSLHADGDRFRLLLDGVAPVITDAMALTDPARPATVGLSAVPATLGPALPLREVVARLPALRALTLREAGAAADGGLRLVSLREFAQVQPLYVAQPDGTLTDRLTGTRYRADLDNGFFTSAEGDRLQPGFRVNVGLRHYAQVFSEGKFREPFLSVFVWTVVFSGLTVLFGTALGLLLAVLLNWDSLQFKGTYRLVLFLPYAVPGFISILVFKGLFNQNLGEINLILNGLFGIRPAWFSDPFLAKTMLLIVNVWLGFPYMMVLCSGLIKSIPADLYEASAVAGAGPLVNFRRITLPLIVKPLTPLLISAFAFNFNNFVLISLLTGGRPDQLDATLPAGTTDILVSYTWRIAFQDSGQQFGLAAAISTVIFLIVAAITLLQMRITRLNEAQGK